MLRILQTPALALAVFVGGLDAHDEQREEHAALAGAMSEALVVPASRSRRPYHWGFCRRAPGGCRARLDAFAWSFVRHGRRHEVDPWTLAAMAWVESRYNPAVTGAAGERGILQLLPRWRRGLPFFREKAECLRKTDACQDSIIGKAARMLARSVEVCGSVESGLGRYNTGRCVEGTRYARGVELARRKLRSLAE